MSPSASHMESNGTRQPRDSTSDECFPSNLNISVLGLAVEYPPYSVGPEGLEYIAEKFYPKDVPALQKLLQINRFTGIERKSTFGPATHPIVNGADPPSISVLHRNFLRYGVPLSVDAARKALHDARLHPGQITHMVSTTCTHSANPGFDHYVAKSLGLGRDVEKVLLHGIGCSGGLAAIRVAANLVLGARARGRRAKVLVVACEVSSVLVRSELDSVCRDGQVRIGAALFSDAASACVVGDTPPLDRVTRRSHVANGHANGDLNGIHAEEPEEEEGEVEPVYDILGWKHEVLEETEDDLGFDVDPLGWKVILTQRVPFLTSAAVPACFESLVSSVPSISPRDSNSAPLPASHFDWALHPGGSTIISGIEKVMNLTPMHLRSSYETYINHGNSSSATIMSVMDHLRRSGEGRQDVVACAFGPGINVEMALLKKRMHRKPRDAKAETNGLADGLGDGAHESLETPPSEPLD